MLVPMNVYTYFVLTILVPWDIHSRRSNYAKLEKKEIKQQAANNIRIGNIPLHAVMNLYMVAFTHSAIICV